MITSRRTAADLLRHAGDYARHRQAPVNTIVKEMLHYEIVQALILSGAAQTLVFHGGTCLRLCYQGNRYSEDLDFVGGRSFEPAVLARFSSILGEEISNRYGLTVDVNERVGRPDADGVATSRWAARIAVPTGNPAQQQKQVINLEVANIPAHDVTIMPIAAHYDMLTPAQRGLMLRSETAHEILADKLKAVVTRPFLKYRDVWDIKFLLDRGERINGNLIDQKLTDYGVTRERYIDTGREKLLALKSADAERGFMVEMSRFLDAGLARMFDQPATVRAVLNQVHDAIETAVQMIEGISLADRPSSFGMSMG